ncbi:MAG: RnfABCDGE type electron transport complex subunit B [Gammaproteobacteria bacterium]|nr:RnfABCDGE type electron transport complex subunit B [Gammaproteobacteria bacterium]MDE0411441.1 RnfABCDGE type electron transport complex subunit B [Gammaproteobacteria bacterium]
MQDFYSGIATGKFIARIDEQRCIGCTLCIKACPFDAILGASRHTHTVITRYCTGCKLCLAPCPVNCIELKANTKFHHLCITLPKIEQRKLKEQFAASSRESKRRRIQRIERNQRERQELFELRKEKILLKKRTSIQSNERGKM